MSDEMVAIITGANRGLGLEFARQLAGRGYRTVITDRDDRISDEAAAIFEREGLAWDYERVDVTDDSDVARIGDALRQNFGRADVLINNAGIQGDPGIPEHPEDFAIGTFFKAKPETALRTMNTNALGAFRMCQAVIPLMRERGYGRVVNIASGMGQLADMKGGWACYRMSKTAINALTRIVADEVKGEGILVNSACPGWTRTQMGGATATRSVEEGADTIIWLATLPDDGPSGGFFHDRKPYAW
jgi:NAD(P)-dependent dehydrogenase (short-subunit alcohol dehydrogenase family)